GSKLGGGLKPLVGTLIKSPQKERVESFEPGFRTNGRRLGMRSGKHLLTQLPCVLCLERLAARHDFVGDDPERPQVSSNARLFAVELFRAHVARCAGE